MRRYEIAVIRRAVTRVQGALGQRRVLLTAERGFADVALVDVLTELGVPFILRGKGSTKVAWPGRWRWPPCPLSATPTSAIWVTSPIARVARIGCG